MDKVSLAEIYHQEIVEAYNLTPFQEVVDAYLHNAQVGEPMWDRAVTLDNSRKALSPWQLLDQWRELIILMLILHDKQQLQQRRDLFIDKVKQLQSEALWPEFQLLSSYQKLAAVLLQQKIKNIPILQSENGSAPLEGLGHWAWGEVPHPLFHAELGILWSLLGQFTGEKHFFSAVEKLAAWQMQTLDHQFSPFVGLYALEEDAVPSVLLISNVVLFDAVGRLLEKANAIDLSEKMMFHVAEMASKYSIKVPAHLAVFNQWFSKNIAPQKEQITLSSSFADKDLAFVGCRSQDSSAVATIFGGRSGMGCFHFGDVQVVNFGPQHLPLGDCRGFGLEGAGRLLSGHLSFIDASEQGFVIEGMGRVASCPQNEYEAGFRQGIPSGMWIDTTLNFKNGKSFAIEAEVSGLTDRDFAFAFFVKAPSCVVDDVVGGKQEIKHRSLKQYSGSAIPVLLQGKSGNLVIEETINGGKMQVIPLSGGDNFWGADFLIAYMCRVGQKSSWLIKTVP